VFALLDTGRSKFLEFEDILGGDHSLLFPDTQPQTMGTPVSANIHVDHYPSETINMEDFKSWLVLLANKKYSACIKFSRLRRIISRHDDLVPSILTLEVIDDHIFAAHMERDGLQISYLEALVLFCCFILDGFHVCVVFRRFSMGSQHTHAHTHTQGIQNMGGEDMLRLFEQCCCYPPNKFCPFWPELSLDEPTRSLMSKILDAQKSSFREGSIKTPASFLCSGDCGFDACEFYDIVQSSNFGEYVGYLYGTPSLLCLNCQTGVCFQIGLTVILGAICTIVYVAISAMKKNTNAFGMSSTLRRKKTLL